jgi:hypothetical protein
MKGNAVKDYVKTDRELEAAASSTAEAIAAHRWHWTLDESNPERVSIREYAREVGRHRRVIGKMAQGYADWTAGAAGGATLSECIERASMSAESEAATEAVAEARGITFKTARQSRPVETRRVREIARERAEQRGTTVEEEAPKVADWIVKSEQAEQRRQDERKERIGLRFVEMEGHLTKAKRALVDALNLSHNVPWGDEERELQDIAAA